MDLRLSKGVRKVVVVNRENNGKTVTTTVYKKTRAKKTSTLSEAEKVARAAGESAEQFNQEYLARHDESSRKKQDGWLRDMPYNLYRATRKASRKLKLLPIPVPYTVIDQGEEDDGDDE
ncbi:MAG: hypothetical protein JNM18_10845 [Planctomycetaceae bacterium]|nr:hypothetical protein [Planctomycetaceae bacterium]